MENRAGKALQVSIGVSGMLGHRQQRIRSLRAFHDWNGVSASASTIVLEGAASPSYCAFAIASASDDAVAEADAASAIWHVWKEVSLAVAEKSEDAFLIACGTEPDGAIATLGVMRRRGWRNLLATTRSTLQKIEQSTSDRAGDGLINRNLLFAFFTGIERAIDYGRVYPVR